MAPPDDQRCKADRRPLSDGSRARCMRRATAGALCAQHAKIAVTAAFHCEYCGGNDELPPDHRMDCTRPSAEGSR